MINGDGAEELSTDAGGSSDSQRHTQPLIFIKYTGRYTENSAADFRAISHITLTLHSPKQKRILILKPKIFITQNGRITITV